MTTSSGGGRFGDQQGNPVTLDELFESLGEAILANVIACEMAGIDRGNIRMVVGQDGGTVIGDGMVFQTPVTQRLSDEHGRQLFSTFARINGDYEAGRIPEEKLEEIRERHNVAHKIQAIRDARNRQR